MSSTIFKADPMKYISGLTRLEYKVLEYFIYRRHLKYMKFKNATIASHLDCSLRTVIRATNKFEKDGILSKSQINKFSPNEYKLLVPKESTYIVYLNKLSNQQLNALECGIVIDKNGGIKFSYENVTQRLESFKENKYIYKKPIPITRARENVNLPHGSKPGKDGFSFQKGDKRRLRVMKGISMLKYEQKKWLEKNSGSPMAKEIVNSPKVSELLFTPLIKKITSFLGLDDRERLKLLAFTEEVLTYSHNLVASSKRVKDIKAYFFSSCSRYCKEKGISPDWKWYFTICEILGFEAIQNVEKVVEIKPAIGYHRPFKKEVEPTLQDKIDRVRRDIEGYKSILEEGNSYAVRYVPNLLKAAQDKLAKLMKGEDLVDVAISNNLAHRAPVSYNKKDVSRQLH